MSTDRQRPRFRRREKESPVAESPELLFGDLPRLPDRVGPLWSHQADLLRTYHEQHQDTPDVALELPTGSGKTLVGLLIAEWRRRSLRHRVLYACPTKQLALQVAEKAAAEGIQVVLLIGSHRDWDQRDWSRYSQAAAIGVTTYSAIFNSNPRLGDAQTLLFDDAHAGEQYAAGAWSLAVPRTSPLYFDLFDTVRPHLDAHLVSRMTDESSPGSDHEVRLLPTTVVNECIEDLDRVLAAGVKGKESYSLAMLRPGLRSCLFYVARSGWYVRPMLPPTFEHRAFTDAVQRIYLSATLGEAGELERAFGRAPIARVPVPPAWQVTGSGRRFFVFPSLADCSGTSQAELLRQLADLSPKRLILAPDDKTVKDIADALEVPEDKRFDAKNPATGITPFLKAAEGTLLAANRYDGMDLRDKTCRLMVMSGLPDATHLQDRFLASKLRAENVLLERVRSRVLQGAGRCTRGPNDWAVVIVHGADLLKFLERAEVRKALPLELQAEIEFGLHVSSVTAEELVSLARSGLEQDEIWQEDAEPDLIERRRESTRVAAIDAAALASSAPREVKAWQAAWAGDWDAASLEAVAVLESLTGPALRPYRALWAYLGSAWSALAAQQGVPGAKDRAAQMLRTAHQAAERTTWLREVQPLPLGEVANDPADDDAVTGVIGRLTGEFRSATKFDTRTSAMLVGLANSAATEYETGLVTLGLLLGADSSKPSTPGRADAVWRWIALWATVEAKSEQQAEGTVSLDYVRQANTQMDSLVGDLGGDPAPPLSFSVLVSPRRVVEPTAVSAAGLHLHLVSPDTVLDIAHDAVRAWKALRASTVGVQGEERRTVVARIMWEHRVLPTQVRERLTAEPVRGR